MNAHSTPEMMNRKVITDFVEAINSRDIERLLALFAADAIVNDQLNEVQGLAEIGEWAKTDVAGVSLSIEAISIRRHYGSTIMKGSVDGTFDKRGLPDPLLYKFYFVLSFEKIALLVVLRDEA
ncbi:SnoaL-like protein [Neorhizobium alkalisoli]|uniref:SnoaL-like protein n=2 Tax=Neorhizobium alkalisoli TaxID=528178 RepID=A0A561QBH1_9HYPH|nr:SnoaL-like protein [Neorhizobium alkalisoli]